ncbi:Intercellular signal essential for a variety of patterning events during development (By similarity) [Seminavis robusta]|uniref:Intercellular signal essential for a variety of patterning events during development By similarity n=1 Tax=Seminavis robusta TaxID=568900 RepID=A0A9N8HFY5_9STRA|nr:Intercellular signal essential for a variety of patterning events during development (By similarity) [Seminavis robusta]|eukprot:Sro546_g164160.1 Intercellular signal essential for a variety of patterning events during development (By similarity) (234) ;mRNA; r:59863-60564
MSDLVVGENVLVDPFKQLYEPVYSFGHYHKSWEAEFVELHTAGFAPLQLTANHLVHILGESEPVRADQVRKGDLLWSMTGAETVTAVKATKKTGLYMPLTPSGNIVENGIVASTYVSIQSYAPCGTTFLVKIVVVRAHARACLDGTSTVHLSGFLFESLPISEHREIAYGCLHPGVLSWLLVGKSLAEWGIAQTLPVQWMAGLPVAAMLSLMVLLEYLFGALLAPWYCLSWVF